MTRFLSMRTSDVAGGVVSPMALDCDGSAPFSYRPVNDAVVARDVRDCEVVLAVHGFNLSRSDGVRAMIPLEQALGLNARQRFFGVLWPGDFYLPVLNYPWEARLAVRSGAYLADYCNKVLRGASSLSLISHSLGARVLLETVQRLDRSADELCITAGAVDRDCLEKQYIGASNNAHRITILSSTRDKVLMLAYPVGDWISDVLLEDNDSPWQAALGRAGPKPVRDPEMPVAIPPAENYDHGDYLPKGDPLQPIDPNARWLRVAALMSQAIEGAPPRWT